MTGRRSKLTDENRSAIARRLAAGETIAEAAAAGAVHVATLERWLARGRAALDLQRTGAPVPAREKPMIDLMVAIDQASLELTDQIRGQIASYLSSGAELAQAAAAANVTHRALERWLELGRQARERRDAGIPPGDADRIYLDLLNDVDRARAEAEVTALATIRTAMLRNGDVGAAKFYLERVHPERYARRQGRPTGIPQELREELEQLRAEKATTPADTKLDTLRARVAARRSA